MMRHLLVFLERISKVKSLEQLSEAYAKVLSSVVTMVVKTFDSLSQAYGERKELFEGRIAGLQLVVKEQASKIKTLKAELDEEREEKNYAEMGL